MRALQMSKRRKNVEVCGVDGCLRLRYSRGWCKRHYMQILRHGKLTPEREHGRAVTCSAPNCPNKRALHGYCRKHDRQVRVYGKLTPEREYTLGLQQCNEPGCNEPVRAKGKCARHYNQQWRRDGESKETA